MQFCTCRLRILSAPHDRSTSSLLKLSHEAATALRRFHCESFAPKPGRSRGFDVAVGRGGPTFRALPPRIFALRRSESRAVDVGRVYIRVRSDAPRRRTVSTVSLSKPSARIQEAPSKEMAPALHLRLSLIPRGDALRTYAHDVYVRRVDALAGRGRA